MARKPVRPKSSIHDRASALNKKTVAAKPKKVVIAKRPIVPVKTAKIVKPIIKAMAKPIAKKALQKKVVKKSIVKPLPKPIPKQVIKKPTGSVEKQLVENFIALQKVMVNLSMKFETLSNNITKLLDLFEISAKALAKKDFSQEKKFEDTKAIKNKVDNLFEQNKVIARGLTLLHEGLLGEEPPMPEPPRPPVQRPLPPQQPPKRPPMPPRQLMRRPPQQQPPAPQTPPPTTNPEEYEKSLSTPGSQSQQFKKLPGPPGQGA